jgi:glycerol 2-dehydrogenase (NADP+)
MYGVDSEVGEAIRESGIPRSEIFITSKFWPHFAAPENVELCLDIVLRQTGIEYVDLWLAHWPYAAKPISREALEKAKAGPKRTPEEKGQAMEGGKPVIDWEHSSSNLARIVGSWIPQK